MSEWREIQLREIVEIKNGFAFKSSDFVDSGIPVIKIKNVKPNNILLNTLSYVNEEVANGKDQFLIQPDDILITMSGNRADGSPESWVGKVALFKKNGKYLLNQRVSIIRTNQAKADRTFIAYYLSSWNSQLYFINNANSSGGQANISPDIVKDLELSLPPLEEQIAIASVLSSLDDKIDLLHRQNQTLEQMAETLFRQWFVEEADEEWEWHQLDEYIEVQRGLSYKGVGLTDANNGVPMHNLNSVFEGGGYKEAGIKYYKGEFKERHKVYQGDVIVTNTEQGHEHLLIGYPAIVPSNFGESGIFSQHIYRLEIKSTLSNFFLFHLLKTNDVHEQIAGATNGSTVNMLSKDGVEWVKFRMPPQELIDDFTQIANDYYKKQELNQTQIRTLTALRDTLLPKLMSGEVSLSNFGEVRVEIETKK